LTLSSQIRNKISTIPPLLVRKIGGETNQNLMLPIGNRIFYGIQ
jgi:hypothetical protein